MVLRTRPEEDEWQDVTDARKRKQIQDRLAQRARRRRLREARDNDSPPVRNHNATNLGQLHLERSLSFEASPVVTTPSWQVAELFDEDVTTPVVMNRQASNDSEEPIDWQLFNLSSQAELSLLDPMPSDRSLTHPSLLPSNINTLPSPSSTSLTLPLTVFTALFLNGQILQITCSTLLASKSPPPSPQTPLSLRPTTSQLTTVHYQWIDRLPFPKLRDSLIRLQTVLDLDDFLQDIFIKPSFEIEKGARSWEARKWRMAEGWRAKWGWLFF